MNNQSGFGRFHFEMRRNLTGLMNAADYYGLEELRKACMGFVCCCITVDTVCALLASAERYIQYKCTKSLVQRVSVGFYFGCETVFINL